MATTHHKTDLKSELDKSIAFLRTLRDEVKVQVHLGRLDAQTKWHEVEPRLEAALQKAATEASEASQKAILDATKALERFADSLRN
jgi:imidazoleglycerol phosphate dehydratase HisB